MGDLLFQTSLIASFVAGMVALFAPCCITFLLPAYLGSVFKEKERVLLMTLVFGLGILVVLMPAVLGVAFVSQALFRYHDTVYLLGGLVMLAVSLISFLGLKLPMPVFAGSKMGGKTDVVSIFTLGIFSGLTSACCAPVLIGILAITFLSPSFFGAILVGVMYVLGMVTPLLLISLFLSGKAPRLAFLKRPLGNLKLMDKNYPLILSNLLAGALFFLTGSLTLILLFNGKLSMARSEEFAKTIQNAGFFVSSQLGGSNLTVNLIFLLMIGLFLYLVVKKV